jgi:hypothetical protein
VRAPTPPQKAVPKTRTVGTQSLYRESETQTLPYSPDYVLPSDGAVCIYYYLILGLVTYLYTIGARGVTITETRVGIWAGSPCWPC